MIPVAKVLNSIEMSSLGLNIMSVRQAQKAFKKKSTQAMFYYIKGCTEIDAEVPGSDERSATLGAPEKENVHSGDERSAQRSARENVHSGDEWSAQTSAQEKDKSVRASDGDKRSAELKAQEKKLKQLLEAYKDVFRAELPEQLPPKRFVDHRIDTGDSAAVNTNAYSMLAQQLKEQLKQIHDLLDKGLIRESSSPWGSPVLFVKKANGTWRMCVDYRALNSLTKKNGYPLPRIQECLDQLGHASHLTALDLTSGYWQIRVADEDIPKTAFNTRYGKYEFLVMPFGLTNAPATFQTLVNNILRPFLDKFVVVYLDDITVYSNSFEEHMQHLKQVLDVLRQNQLYAQPKKYVFNQPEIQFCRHIVGNGLVRVMKDKVEAIQKWPQPRNVHDVRQFLGVAGYYRRFIRNYSLIALPLTELLKVGEGMTKLKKFEPVVWNTAHQSAFEQLKRVLTEAPVLMQPRVDQPFIIETDASDAAIGGCLLQYDMDGKLHPVAYSSMKLSPAQFKYPVHEKELLAIKEALRVWACYVDNGHEVTILTDHESLKYMNTIKRPSKRLVRWIDEFQAWKLNIKYRRGSEAIVPDALSRRPDLLNAMALGLAPEKDEYVVFMEAYLRDKTLPGNEFDELIKNEAPHFVIVDDRLMRRVGAEGDEAPYLEWQFRGDFIQRMHNEYGHMSREGMNDLTLRRAWWPKMDKDIQEFVKSCPSCQVGQRERRMTDRE